MNTTMALAAVSSMAHVAAMTVPQYLSELTAQTGIEHGCECGRTWLKLYRQDSRTSRSAVAFVHLRTQQVRAAKSWSTPGRDLGFQLTIL